jgi:uncharacterized protein
MNYLEKCIALFLPCLIIPPGLHAAEPGRDYPYKPVPFTAVTVEGGFWGPRMQTNREVTVWYDFKKCEETGRIDNFAVAGGLKAGGFRGIYFNDSDVVKVIEGAAYALALQPDKKLDRYLDELIAKIAAAQEDDGYLYTARTIGDPKYNFPGKEARWSHLGHGHELYNVGHMYEAAVAHYRATGKRAFLDVAIKNADLVCRVFGPRQGQRIDVPGHEEIEMGLVRLYRVTGDEKYLRQAKFFIDMRGRKDKRGTVYGPYCQDHKPVVEQTEAVGHAVRGGYLYAGVADVAALTGDQDYLRAIDRIWEDVLESKLYLIGSVGQHGAGEGYAGAWKLDNLKAYNETCAAIALALWNHRMFMLHGHARYIDVLERILYNGFLSGVSLSGDRFFYPNPLACDMHFKFNHGSMERSPWFGCSCCPVNVVRFLPSIPGMAYATRGDAVYVNLFVNGQAETQVNDLAVTLTQRTEYPWQGQVRIEVNPARMQAFTVKLRVPGWVRGRPVPSDLYRYMGDTPPFEGVLVNGKKVDSTIGPDGYLALRRTWMAGDRIELEWPLSIRRVLAHDNVEPDRGRVAVERGPIVYCMEGVDHAHNNSKVMNAFLPDASDLTAGHRPDLLGGVTTLRGRARAVDRQDDGTITESSMDLTLIPYYAWCHRGANEMQVWIPRTREWAKVPPLPPKPTIASEARATASHCNPGDSMEALNDQQEPEDSGDHALPRFTWWGHRGTTEWVQYDFDRTCKLSKVEVYWFDDTGGGGCRIPATWRVLCRQDGQWRLVSGNGPLKAEKDRFNTIGFEPQTTDALRLDVQLQSGFSGGILEWRVE